MLYDDVLWYDTNRFSAWPGQTMRNLTAAEDNQSGADFLRNLGVSEAYIAHFWGFLSHAILNVPVEDCVLIECVLLA